MIDLRLGKHLEKYHPYYKTYTVMHYYDEWMDINSTGINDIEVDTPSRSHSAGIYDLSGRRHTTLQRGINIVCYDDGTVKKVLVK